MSLLKDILDFCVAKSHATRDNNDLPGTMALDVVFYETPSFNASVDHIVKPLEVSSTSFIMYPSADRNGLTDGNAIFRILKFSGKISHEVEMKKVIWCNNTLQYSYNFYFNDDINHYFWYLLYAQNFFLDELTDNGHLYLKMEYIRMNGNHYEDKLRRQVSNGLMTLVNVKNVTMSGINYFADNGGGSVIDVVSSNLTISGYLTISDGHAFQGGGIRLDSASILFLQEPLTATFANNTAYEGSAIYAPSYISRGVTGTSSIQLVPVDDCLSINIPDLLISLRFMDNRDNRTGIKNSIFAPQWFFKGSLLSPKFGFEGNRFTGSVYMYTELINTTIKEMDDFDKYTSLSNGICMQLYRQPWTCRFIDYLYFVRSDPMRKTCYPGQAALSFLYSTNNEHDVIDCTNHRPVDSKYWETTLNQTNSTLSFRFYYDSIIHCFLVVISNIELYMLSTPVIEMQVKPNCPFGFNLTQGKCDCVLLLQEQGYICNIDTLMLTSPKYYWTGFLLSNNGNVLWINKFCPPNYCDFSHQDFILDDSITDVSCLNNRTGILCGQCKENYSAVFGSDVCYDNCTDLYLLTLLMYAIAGLILVVLLFALRLTVATGTINGVIFYANILSLSMDYLIRDYHGPYLAFFRIIIALLNLDLGFPLCFYKGMTTTARVGFQFIFPVYLWSIIIGMIIISKYSVKISNLISKSSVQVLATLFYLSYSKILRTVIDVFSVSTLRSITYYHGGSYSDISEQTVWYYSGEAYGQGVHGFYLFLATAFVVLFLIPYTILVTFSYCFMRFKLVNKFKPFIDAYGGPFKDKWRFWFGLRLWITITLFVVNGALQGTDTREMLVVHFIIIMLFVFIQNVLRPFKNLLIGLTDTLFMANYWLIIQFYLVFPSIFLGAYIFLLSSAIFTLLLIVFLHFLYKVGNRSKILQSLKLFRKSKLFQKLSTVRHRLNGYEVIRENVTEDEDKELFMAADKREKYRADYS